MVVRLALGALLVAMGGGQAVSWPDMDRILADYGLLEGAAASTLAGAIILTELAGGVWLLARPRSHAPAPAWMYTAVAVTWTLLGAQAYARGLDVPNCGCFGAYLAQRLGWFTLVQDGLLLVYAALLVRSARPTVPRVGSVGPHAGSDPEPVTRR